MFRKISDWIKDRQKIRQIEHDDLIQVYKKAEERKRLKEKINIQEYEQIEERKRLEEKRERLEEKLKEELINKAMKIEFFPGNLEEYERLKNEEYEIIDTKERTKGVYYNQKDICGLSKLGELNVEAIIRCRENWVTERGSFGAPVVIGIYGLPVRKKK